MAYHSSIDRNRAALTKESLSSLAPTKIFREAGKKQQPMAVTSITFEDDGKACITAGEDELFTYWSVVDGRRSKYFASAKYGVDHITATHSPGVVLHASTKVNHDVRLHSAHANKYEKYFSGHTGKVISISHNPINSTFLTGSEDQTVMLWDTRAQEARGCLKDLQGPALTAWDSSGTVFAVALPNEEAICLYSASTFDRKPFLWRNIDDPILDSESSPRRTPMITSLQFSNNGRYLLVGSSGDVHWVLDAMDLNIVLRLTGHKGLERDAEGNKGTERRRGFSGQEVRWTPDSQFVISGSHDGQICIWDVRPPNGLDQWPLPEEKMMPGAEFPSRPAPTKTPMTRLNEAKQGGMSRVVHFSPRYNIMVSAGKALVMWLPSKGGKDKDEEEDMDVDA